MEERREGRREGRGMYDRSVQRQAKGWLGKHT
jgi:hypothetical protein